MTDDTNYLKCPKCGFTGKSPSQLLGWSCAKCGLQMFPVAKPDAMTDDQEKKAKEYADSRSDEWYDNTPLLDSAKYSYLAGYKEGYTQHIREYVELRAEYERFKKAAIETVKWFRADYTETTDNDCIKEIEERMKDEL